MTHKPRLHALRACVSETLFTLSDWLFSAGYAVQVRKPIIIRDMPSPTPLASYYDEALKRSASLSEGKDT